VPDLGLEAEPAPDPGLEAEPAPDLGLEAEPAPDPGAVEFGRRGDRRGTVVVAGAEQLPSVRAALLLPQQRGDPYASGSRSRFAVTSRGEHP
jgi:hypothetical protein